MGNTAAVSGAVSEKDTVRGSSPEMHIEFAVSEMQGLRQTMEDQHIHFLGVPVRGPDGTKVLTDHAVFAVFDGHGGDFTSRFLKDNFLDVLSRREEMVKYSLLPLEGARGRSDVNAVTLLQKALTKTFTQLDEKLLPLQRDRTDALMSGSVAPPLVAEGDNIPNSSVRSSLGERSGSTGVVVLISPSHIICANTGDSRAVLRRNGKAVPLSFDHKPSELPERLRIMSTGGTVKGKRVNGDLAVSRAFGDFMYKDTLKSQSKALQQQVTVVPDLIVYPRTDNDEFIVLACDGVWDVASNKQCTDFVQRLLSEGEVDLGNVCEETLDTCLERQSRDNMTMLLVTLPSVKRDTSASAAVVNALWGQRTMRKAVNATRTVFSASHDGCPSRPL